MNANTRQPIQIKFTVGLTQQQRQLLEQAAIIAPGVSTPNGVIRKAIDNYLAELGLTDMERHSSLITSAPE